MMAMNAAATIATITGTNSSQQAPILSSERCDCHRQGLAIVIFIIVPDDLLFQMASFYCQAPKTEESPTAYSPLDFVTRKFDFK
jgi:hypothetical protein